MFLVYSCHNYTGWYILSGIADFGEFDTVPDVQKLHQMRGTVDSTNSHIANAPIILGGGSITAPSASSKSQNSDLQLTSTTSPQGPDITRNKKTVGSTSPVKSPSTLSRLFPSAVKRSADNMDKLSAESSDDESGAICRGRGRGQLIQSRIQPKVTPPGLPRPDPASKLSPEILPQHLILPESGSPLQPSADHPQKPPSPQGGAPLQPSTDLPEVHPSTRQGAPTPSTSGDEQFMDAESSHPAEPSTLVQPEPSPVDSEPAGNNSRASTEDLRSAPGSELSDIDPSILSVGQCSIAEADSSGIACNTDLDKPFDTSQSIPESLFNISPKIHENHSSMNAPKFPLTRSPLFLSNVMASGGVKNVPPIGQGLLRGFTPLNIGIGTPPLKASSPANSNKPVPGFPAQVSSPIMGSPPPAAVLNNSGSSITQGSHTPETGCLGTPPARQRSSDTSASSPSQLTSVFGSQIDNQCSSFVQGSHTPRTGGLASPPSSDTSASSSSQFTSVFGSCLLSESDEEKPKPTAIGRGQLLAKLTSGR